MNEPYYNQDYYKKYDIEKMMLPWIFVPLLMWCFIIYIFIIKPKELPTLFEKIILALPFIYVMIHFHHISHFFGGDEMTTGCLRFPNKERENKDGIIGNWYWESSLSQAKTMMDGMMDQAQDAANVCYGLLLLMLVTTSFKTNMLDIPIITNFSMVLLVITTIILYIVPYGIYGPAISFLVTFNSILTVMGISSFLIVLLNLYRLK